MSQKNKIFSITLSLLILGSVACRKSGGGGDPTPIDPTKSMTGNLLIVSTDGKTNLNSIPLRFAGANATVTKVEVEKGKTLKLDTTNFIVENNALKLTKFDLSKEEAAVSNKVTLTFDLSASSSSPITKYTDTAEIFVGKYSNIYTNQYIGFTNLAKIGVADIINLPYAVQDTEFDFTKMTNATTNETILILENSSQGNVNSKVDTQKFIGVVSNRMYNNSIGNFTNYYNSFFVSFVDTNDNESIAKFKIDFTPKALYNDTNKSYYLIFYLKEGKWDNLGK